ncbi:unnamed protein product [Nippostrongylus brasiliensis]|uniref:Uncharacterized protein n=1 Tax=Nippostrongylus brasiliensis TaxID=27835 RepID=A0A3P7AVW0_NIPBR|nr:unnamed protein product [Nippostrongylus brasiliensis]
MLSAQELLAHLESIKNKDEVCLRTPIQVFVANIISHTLFGFSYKYDKCERLMGVVDEITELFKEMRASKITLIGQVFPAIYRLPFVGYMAKDRIHNMLSGTRRLVIEDCERALKCYSPDQEPECLVQAYFQKMQSNPNLNYDNLLNVCSDFFVAGMETTTTTLRWGTLLLASNQETQEKIRKEILSVIGSGVALSTSYRSMMPYTNAAINELQRRANIVQQNAPYRAVRGTSVGHSPVYKDAHEFRPERFLMDDGITADEEAIEQLCPLSIGKRQCAGEALARVELFVGIVTLLQHYRVINSKYLSEILIQQNLSFIFYFTLGCFSCPSIDATDR